MKLAALVALAAVLAPAGLPGAQRVPVCAAAGAYWPTMTVAVHGGDAWIACKEQLRVIRVDAATGKRKASLPLRGAAIAVTAGLGAVWAVDSGGTLHRIDPKRGRIVKRIALPVRAAYNVWTGGGSVWVADDQGGRVVRVSPKTNRVVARPRVGDGPSDIVVHGASAWVISHRTHVLHRIDLRTNVSRRLAVVPGDTPERMVWSHGALWLTGRGTDLLKVSPVDGAILETIDVGASGIDVAVAGGHLWVPTRSAAVDATGFPTMDALKKVSALTGEVTVVVEAKGRVDVHGLVAANGTVWLADNSSGSLYRFR